MLAERCFQTLLSFHASTFIDIHMHSCAFICIHVHSYAFMCVETLCAVLCTQAVMRSAMCMTNSQTPLGIMQPQQHPAPIRAARHSLKATHLRRHCERLVLGGKNQPIAHIRLVASLRQRCQHLRDRSVRLVHRLGVRCEVDDGALPPQDGGADLLQCGGNTWPVLLYMLLQGAEELQVAVEGGQGGQGRQGMEREGEREVRCGAVRGGRGGMGSCRRERSTMQPSTVVLSKLCQRCIVHCMHLGSNENGTPRESTRH